MEQTLCTCARHVNALRPLQGNEGPVSSTFAVFRVQTSPARIVFNAASKGTTITKITTRFHVRHAPGRGTRGKNEEQDALWRFSLRINVFECNVLEGARYWNAVCSSAIFLSSEPMFLRGAVTEIRGNEDPKGLGGLARFASVYKCLKMFESVGKLLI